MKNIDICLNCTEKECKGTCERIRKANRRSGRFLELTANGETHTLGEWAEITGLRYSTIKQRIDRGETGGEVLRPTRERKRRVDNGKPQTNSRG